MGMLFNDVSMMCDGCATVVALLSESDGKEVPARAKLPCGWVATFSRQKQLRGLFCPVCAKKEELALQTPTSETRSPSPTIAKKDHLLCVAAMDCQWVLVNSGEWRDVRYGFTIKERSDGKPRYVASYENDAHFTCRWESFEMARECCQAYINHWVRENTQIVIRQPDEQTDRGNSYILGNA